MAADGLLVRTARLAASLSALTLAFGCGDDGAAHEASGEPEVEAEAEAEVATDEAAERDAPSSALFPQRDGARRTGGPTEEVACGFLTAARAAELLEAPEGELVPQGDCAYRWESNAEVGYASVTRLYVYDSVAGARESFRTATADRGSDDTQAEAAAIHEAAAERLGGEGRAAHGSLRAAVEGAADFAQRYEPVEGIGDEAAFARHDGSLIVRLANARFAVTAYRCPREPARPPPTRAQLRDLGAMAREARAHTQRWIADTIDTRRRMSLELAGQLVDALEAYRASL